jgi:hypothetical protein
MVPFTVADVAVNAPAVVNMKVGEPVGPEMIAFVEPGVIATVSLPETTVMLPDVMLPRFALIAERLETFICAAVMVDAAI